MIPFPACCISSENLLHSNSGKFPNHPLEKNKPTILDGPMSRNPVDINQLSVRARQLGQLYLSANQETFDSRV
jgi:hypothetical protein